MKIISWNVNGLRAVIKKNFLDYINDESPDILCLQETKLQEEQIPEEVLAINGYHKYWSFAEKKGYSGVAVFTKEEPISVSNTIEEDRFDNEGRILRLEYKDFILYNIYFPNGQMSDERLQYKMDFYDQFLKVVKKLDDEGKNVIVCGDYNTAHKEIDLKNPKSNKDRSGFLPIEREWIDKYIANGFVDTFREFDKSPEQYSWWSYRFKAREKNAGWRIDYFFVNERFKDSVKNAFIQQEVMGSDHCPIGIEI